MGLTLKIKDDEIRITNSVDFNKFLNEVSKFGRSPSLLDRSWAYGSFRYDFAGEMEVYVSSLDDLKAECSILFNLPLTKPSKFILIRIQKACEIAINKKTNIQII